MNSSIITSFNYILCLSYRHLRASRAAQTTEDTRPAENNDDTQAARLLTTHAAETNDDTRGAETTDDTSGPISEF